MYRELAHYYDIIYSWKNYKKETETLHKIIGRYKKSPGDSVLDLACGTGEHISFLRKHYLVEGLDSSEEMLSIARRKHPDIVFHKSDMTRFNLNKQFDVVTCLFSAIGHVKTAQNLRRAVRSMARHVYPGGVVIVEPWITPKNWKPGRVDANFVDKPDLKIARIATGGRSGRFSLNTFHYLIGSPDKVEYLVDNVRMGLFTYEEYMDALRSAGLKAYRDPKGLMGRGLYIGTRPSEE